MRSGDKVYLANRINDNIADTAEFSKPVEITLRANYFSIAPATSRGALEFLKHGESVHESWVCIANNRIFGRNIEIGDVMWIEGEQPLWELEEKYGYGYSANAEVAQSVSVGLTQYIVLRTNPKRQTK